MRTGWKTMGFEDCVEAVTPTAKVKRRSFLESGAYPVISQEEEFINGYWDEEADVQRVPTPIVVFGDHTRILKYIDFDFVVGADGVKILRPRESLLPKFLYYRLQAENLAPLGYARHYKLLRELRIAFPPLSEQGRIVGILDKAFEGIAIARANAERSAENASALFEAHLATVFAGQDERWPAKSIGELCEILDSQRRPVTKRDRVPGDVPYYGATGVQDFVRDFIFDEPLVLVGEDGAKWGPGEQTAFAVTGRSWVNNHAHVLRPLRDLILDDWLIFYLNWADLGPFIAGATVQKLTQGSLRSIPVPVPSLPVQEALSESVRQVAAATRRLSEICEGRRTQLDALKQSVLSQAFSGNL